MADFRTITLTRSVALAALMLAIACSGGRTRLVVRTDFPKELRDAAESTFEEQYPDVDVRFSVAADSTSLREVMDESEPAPFDVWWGASAVSLDQAARGGRLGGTAREQPIRFPPQGSWRRAVPRGEVVHPVRERSRHVSGRRNRSALAGKGARVIRL